MFTNDRTFGDPTGVLATACLYMETQVTRETPLDVSA